MSDAVETNTTQEGEQGPVTTTAPAANPEPILGKFKSQEDLIEAYKALESKLGSKEPPAATPAKALTKKDLKAFEDEVYKQGALSEESFEKLQAKGIDKDVAKDWVENFQAKATLAKQEIFKAAGGEESYTQIVQAASENLSDAEITSFNKALESGDLNLAVMAVKSLKADYLERGGKLSPNLVKGSPSIQGAADVFKSRQEAIKAQSDPRYHRGGPEFDPAYEREVQEKLARSRLFTGGSR